MKGLIIDRRMTKNMRVLHEGHDREPMSQGRDQRHVTWMHVIGCLLSLHVDGGRAGEVPRHWNGSSSLAQTVPSQRGTVRFVKSAAGVTNGPKLITYEMNWMVELHPSKQISHGMTVLQTR